MRRLSQSVKNRLFSRGTDSGEHEPPPPACVPEAPVPQRLSLPKIDLDQLGVYEEEDSDSSRSASGGSNRSLWDSSSDRVPSPVYKMLDRRASTPSPGPLSPASASAVDFEQPHASCGKNTPRVVKKIQRLCEKGPSEDDRDGYIYILHSLRDGKQPYYKLRFSFGVLTDSDVGPLKKVCRIPVTKCQLAEKLIVLMLDSMAILRYPLDDDPQCYHTYHKRTRQLVQDAMHNMATGKPRLLTKPEADWFMMTQEVLQRIVQQAVLIVDELKRQTK